MARITVEDCLENIDNIFELVLVAAKRARRLANGAETTLELENDKPTVLALREIAAGAVTGVSTVLADDPRLTARGAACPASPKLGPAPTAPATRH